MTALARSAATIPLRACTERLLLVLLGVGLRHLWPLGQGFETPTRSASKTAAREAAAAASTSMSSPRPHIVIVLLDDAGAGDAGALGHPLLKTPHIDRFAASAVSFSQAYAGAPNCSPSRAALLTGRASFRTGVYDFLSKSSGSMHFARTERTIANLLRGSGYATAHFGKWHLSRGRHGFSPFHFGFEHSNGSFVAASALVRNLGGWMHHGRRFDQPFFAYLALWEPHEPVHYWSPRRLRRLYSEHAIGHAGWSDGGDTRRRGRRLSTLEDLAPAVASGGGGCVWRLERRKPPRIYYGAISQVDESFGWLLSELERQGTRRDTLIMLTSDNGPEHRELNSWGSSGGLRGAKGYVYEGGIRVPLLLQWPSTIAVAAVVHEPVHLWDVLPTICALLGLAMPIDRVIDGVSLLPLLQMHVAGGGAGMLATADGTMSDSDSDDPARDPAAVAAAAELVGLYVRTRRYVELPPPPAITLPPSQPLPLPRPLALSAGDTRAPLARQTPLFWAMHRGRGGMQYALRSGPWKLIGGYGSSAARGDGPKEGGEVVPWLRQRATLGRVELYLISHDPAERVDLAAAHPHVVSVLLSQMQKLLRETARDGPDVEGWTQRAPPCPRHLRQLNVTELCCQPLGLNPDEEVSGVGIWAEDAGDD